MSKHMQGQLDLRVDVGWVAQLLKQGPKKINNSGTGGKYAHRCLRGVQDIGLKTPEASERSGRRFKPAKKQENRIYKASGVLRGMSKSQGYQTGANENGEKRDKKD